MWRKNQTRITETVVAMAINDFFKSITNKVLDPTNTRPDPLQSGGIWNQPKILFTYLLYTALILDHINLVRYAEMKLAET